MQVENKSSREEVRLLNILINFPRGFAKKILSLTFFSDAPLHLPQILAPYAAGTLQRPNGPPWDCSLQHQSLIRGFEGIQICSLNVWQLH
jgi:hypothetical protein